MRRASLGERELLATESPTLVKFLFRVLFIGPSPLFSAISRNTSLEPIPHLAQARCVSATLPAMQQAFASISQVSLASPIS